MRLIGMLSGTSVDGIDAACVEIAGDPGGYSIHLAAFHCTPWPDALRAAIIDACRPNTPLPWITVMNFRIGEAFAQAAIHAVEKAGWNLDSVDAIASHGQTLWHQPVPIEVAGTGSIGTLQLG